MLTFSDPNFVLQYRLWPLFLRFGVAGLTPTLGLMITLGILQLLEIQIDNDSKTLKLERSCTNEPPHDKTNKDAMNTGFHLTVTPNKIAGDSCPII